jgi:hypothetical protein
MTFVPAPPPCTVGYERGSTSRAAPVGDERDERSGWKEKNRKKTRERREVPGVERAEGCVHKISLEVSGLSEAE